MSVHKRFSVKTSGYPDVIVRLDLMIFQGTKVMKQEYHWHGEAHIFPQPHHSSRQHCLKIVIWHCLLNLHLPSLYSKWTKNKNHRQFGKRMNHTLQGALRSRVG